ncbi:hypothetical protein WN944_021029 [Citrus x changshan-huyou]|uniref:Uncharacterized protein n=1 Tax=Citrus x changshan-huyou TaxID=2935761 RepID=A0AAP0N0S3_9ROSI
MSLYIGWSQSVDHCIRSGRELSANYIKLFKVVTNNDFYVISILIFKAIRCKA